MDSVTALLVRLLASVVRLLSVTRTTRLEPPPQALIEQVLRNRRELTTVQVVFVTVRVTVLICRVSQNVRVLVVVAGDKTVPAAIRNLLTIGSTPKHSD